MKTYFVTVKGRKGHFQPMLVEAINNVDAIEKVQNVFRLFNYSEYSINAKGIEGLKIQMMNGEMRPFNECYSQATQQDMKEELNKLLKRAKSKW